MILYHGDCLEEMSRIKEVDLILTDIPYGVTEHIWDSRIPFEPLWEHFNRLSKGPTILFGSQPFTSILIMSNLEQFRYCWYWEKERLTNLFKVKDQPGRTIEEIVVFGNISKYYPQKEQHSGKIVRTSPKGKHQNGRDIKPYQDDRTRYPTQKLYFPRDTVHYHPSQKPIALLEYLIKTYTQEGDIVLDCCMGSGSTGIACLNTQREFIGIEMYPLPSKEINKKTNPDWFGIAKNRIDRHQFKPIQKPDKYGNLSLF